MRISSYTPIIFIFISKKRSPFGPDVHPSRCPKVLRRLFKGSTTALDEYAFDFAFLSPSSDEQQFKNAYGRDSFVNVPQRAVKNWPLEKLTFTEWQAGNIQSESTGMI